MICILADFFREDLPQGGGERATDALIEQLRVDQKVITKRTVNASPDFVKNFEGSFLVSNRQGLSEESKQELYNKKYVLYEHDFAWLTTRDIGVYEDFNADPSHIINFDLYKNAKQVFFQSDAQYFAAKKNLKIDNLTSLKGNVWSQSDLDYLKTLQNEVKDRDYAVLNHPYPTKGTATAVKFCQENQFQYDILPYMEYRLFLKELARYKSLVFMPQIFETYSRVCAEAAMLKLDLLVNQSVAFQYEEYSRLKGLDLIAYYEENNPKIKATICDYLK